MNIEETLAKYSKEYDKLEEATNKVIAARVAVSKALHDN